jgi:hypothetical protein
MGEMRSSYISVGKPEGKRPLGRHRCKWEDNNYVELQEILYMVWTGFIWLRIGSCDGSL